MLHHRTTDPAQRAWDVAEREASEAFCNTGDTDELFTGSLARYRERLREFMESEAADAAEET